MNAVDSKQMVLEALRLLHDAAKLENRGESDPIHVRVTKEKVVVIRHAKNGSTEESPYVLPEGSP